jgi:hypothetical protein
MPQTADNPVLDLPVQAAYGLAKSARLVEIKTKYVPANMFHSSADIAPLG